MDVHINEIVSSIRTLDHDQLLSPQLIERIVREVQRASEERAAYHKRTESERKVTSGVRDEQEGQAY
jgi:hypothetical protein